MNWLGAVSWVGIAISTATLPSPIVIIVVASTTLAPSVTLRSLRGAPVQPRWMLLLLETRRTSVSVWVVIAGTAVT